MFDGKNDISMPDWIENEASVTAGIDLLGLRNPAQQISNRLLSGITTVTPRIRYLTFRAWIVRTYINFRLPANWSSFYEFASRMESAIVIGNLLNKSTISSLVGSDKALVMIGKDPEFYTLKNLVDQIATSIYQNPSIQLGISFKADTSPITGLSNEIGVKLADILGKQIENTEFFSLLKINHKLDKVSRECLFELGKACFLNPIPEEERNFLIDIILPSDNFIELNHQSINNLATYSALLQISKNKRCLPKEEDLFQASIHPKSELFESIEFIRDGWLLYTMRDMIAAVHEATLQDVTGQLERQAKKGNMPSIRDVVRRLLNNVDDIDDLLKKIGLLRRHESYINISIRTVSKRMDQKIQKDITSKNGLVRWNDDSFNEIQIYQHALGYEGSVGLLPVAWLLAAKRVQDVDISTNPLAEHLAVGDWWRMGIPQIIQPTVSSWMARDLNMYEVVAELVYKTIDQHLRIVWERNALNPRKDVSVFSTDGSRLIYHSRFTADRTDSRLHVAISWLNQLQLIGPKGITSLGEEILKRSKRTLASLKSEGVV